jgi:lysine 2,3-aminomutase
MARHPRSFTGSPQVPFREVLERIAPAARDDAALREAARRFPVRWTRSYLDLVDPRDDDDPIRRIAFPDPTELFPSATDLDDPVGERATTPVPYVVRKHRDRAVLLVASSCHVYCRFCFRRSFPDGAHRDPRPAELESAIRYVTSDADLREVILSGGDPLVLPDAELERIVGRLAESPHLRSIRIHTRAPVHDPARVTPALARALASGPPAWVVTHFDHPREITRETGRVVETFLAAGLPLLNQSVLLAGVNDDVEVLEALFVGLWGERIKPYYLHHPDRVPGAGAFWVDPERGLALYEELRNRLRGGPALPEYVIDLPDGTGKIPVARALADRRLAGIGDDRTSV